MIEFKDKFCTFLKEKIKYGDVSGSKLEDPDEQPIKVSDDENEPIPLQKHK